MNRLVALVSSCLLLSSCEQPRTTSQPLSADEVTTNLLAEAADASPAEIEAEQLQKRVAELEAELAKAKAKTKAPTIAERAASPVEPVSMCYKDYCPCEQPQEGMDSVICDQLEAGMHVPVATMIAGRGGREYRRQASEIGF